MQKASAPMKAFVFLESKSTLKSIEFIQLPHPQKGDKRWFGFSGENLYETIQIKDENSSLILSCDRVVRDGSLYLGSLVDPLFIILSELIRHTKKNDNTFRAVTPEQVFSPEVIRVLNLPKCNVEHIAKVQEAFDERYLIFKPEKAVAWLKKKVERVQNALDLKGPSGLKESLGLLAEYVNKMMIEKLLGEYGLSMKEVYRSPRKRKIDGEDMPVQKMDGPCRPSHQGPIRLQANSVKPQAAKKPKKEKPKAYGMKSLASYFKKR